MLRARNTNMITAVTPFAVIAVALCLAPASLAGASGGAPPVPEAYGPATPAVAQAPIPAAHDRNGKGLQLSTLWDQTDLLHENHAQAAQNFEDDEFDCWGADDFVVDASGSWTVRQVVLPGRYSEGGGPVATANITIHADSSGSPGSAVCQRTGSVDDQAGTLTVSLSSACTLDEGRYWLAAQVNLDFNHYGQWFWLTSPDQDGSYNGRWRNPGGGFGTTCINWMPISACTTSSDLDYLFRILGEVNQGGGQQLPTNGDWTSFTWQGAPGVFNTEGPFTFFASTPGSVDVTDAFIAGDRFQVYDFGQLVGTTSAPTGSLNDTTQDPDVAFPSPLWSSGSFPLGVGEHSITIRNTQIPDNHPNGAGFLRWMEGSGQEPPTAQFAWSPVSPAPGQTVQFTDQSLNDPSSWEWSFGDGGTSQERHPTHVFTRAGTYPVSLTVTNQGGSDIRTRNVVVASGPQAGFTWSPTTPVPGQSVQFTDQSSGGPDSWQWSFGDGGSSQQTNPSHIYASAGTYTVALTVTNPSGSDTHSEQLFVGQAPDASFTYSPSNPMVDESVQFTDTSTGQPASWSWSFGDGATSTQRNPTHIYTTAGQRTVTLTVSNALGSDQTSQVVDVQDSGEVIGGGENQATPPGTDVDEGIAAATDPGGNRVIVWKQNAGKRLTPDGLVMQGEEGIFARFFDPQDQPGDIIPVEENPGGTVDNPTVSFDGSGGFVIGWRGGLFAKQGEDGIFARFFGPDREPEGGSFQVDDEGGGEPEAPSVATNTAGDFMMTWRRRIDKQGEDGIFGRAFGNDGQPQGPPFRIDTGGIGVEEVSTPSVAADASGTFVVAWHQRSVAKQGDDGVFSRRFGPTGDPEGGTVQVNTDPEGEPGDPEVAVDPQGNAIVVWRQDVGGSAGVVIRGRPYNRAGEPTGGVFVVNSEVSGSQVNPSVATTPAGDYVIAWESAGGSETGIFGRFFTKDGRPVGDDFEVATPEGGSMPSAPKVTVANDRTVTVAYTRQQGSTRSVHYRTFDVHTAATDCTASGSSMCLNQERFQIQVSWRDFQNNTGVGRAVRLTNDTGYFWFFNQANVELVVKVLDGTAINGYYWVFYGALSNVEYTITVTDSVTGSSVSYFNPSTTFASVGDTAAIPSDGKVVHSHKEFPGTDGSAEIALAGDAVWSELLGSPPKQGSCSPSGTNLCLNGDRFRVEATWRDFQGRTGVGQAVPLTGDTGYFWFFNDANVELILKVLDGRAINGHYWVFYGALSNVEYGIRVTDTATGETRRYNNPLGEFGSVGDTSAFFSP